MNQSRIEKSRQAALKVKELRSLICWKHIAAALKGSLFQVADRTRVPPKKAPVAGKLAKEEQSIRRPNDNSVKQC